MADQADPRRINIGAGAQERHVGGGIHREVVVDRGGKVAGRLCDASVVHAQHRDAVARQPIGDDREGLMAEDRFVAVLGPRTRDQHHRRERALARRQGERARELHPRGALHGHVLGAIGKGWLRGLRALRHRSLLRLRGKDQRTLIVWPFPCAVDRAAVRR
ncbi:hypothetical protein D9M73_148480 [compost metagenome]